MNIFEHTMEYCGYVEEMRGPEGDSHLQVPYEHLWQTNRPREKKTKKKQGRIKPPLTISYALSKATAVSFQ